MLKVALEGSDPSLALIIYLWKVWVTYSQEDELEAGDFLEIRKFLDGWEFERKKLELTVNSKGSDLDHEL